MTAPTSANSFPRPVTRLASWVVVATIAVLGSSTLAGCTLDQSGPPATQISGWLTVSGGGAAIGQVEVDSRNIGLAIARHNPGSAVKTVCALLTTDAQTAIGNLPTPDTVLTNDLNVAYQDAAAAGNDCYNGSDGDKVLLRRSASERDKLPPLLTAAVDRISSLTGKVPSTSTTLPSGDSDDPFGN